MTRTCGKCNLCCVLFSINDPPDPQTGFPGLIKAKGVVCPHSTNKGCDIYNNKGPVCNKYKCLWINNFLPEWMKPDKVGIVFDRFRTINGKIYMLGTCSQPINLVERTIQEVCKMQIPVYLSQRIDGKFVKSTLYEPIGCCQKCKDRQKAMQEKLKQYADKRKSNSAQ